MGRNNAEFGHAAYNRATMSPWNPLQNKPKNVEVPNWDKYHGSAFKFSVLQPHNIIGEDKSDAGKWMLVANVYPGFKDAPIHPDAEKLKSQWPSIWSGMGRYKQNQILSAMRHQDRQAD